VEAEAATKIQAAMRGDLQRRAIALVIKTGELASRTFFFGRGRGHVDHGNGTGQAKLTA